MLPLQQHSVSSPFVTFSSFQVEALLQSGADAAYQDPSDGRSPLMAAASGGYTDVVKALLAAGAPWNAFDRQANCAGDYALAGQHEACIEVLLNAGESPDNRLAQVTKSERMKMTGSTADQVLSLRHCAEHQADHRCRLCTAVILPVLCSLHTASFSDPEHLSDHAFVQVRQVCKQS